MKAVEWLENNATDESLRVYIKDCKDGEYVASSFKEQLLRYRVSEFFEHCRHHHDLVAVVETLGTAADGADAALDIKTISCNQYRIDNYDGVEDVVTPNDDFRWIVID
jgi:hypothetical protein